MKIRGTKLKGAYLLETSPLEDERGYFSRVWCTNELERFDLHIQFVQCNISYNKKSGTLRGMHFQRAPFEEAKLVSCIRGSIYDVIIDLRKDSKTYMKWEAFVLNSHEPVSLYIPRGFAHGYQTLEDNTEVLYHMTQFYHAESSCGVRWNDPIFSINWPENTKRIISCKDSSWEDYIK